MPSESHRISGVFSERKPFIAYLTGGDGGIDYTVECALALVEGGVDLLEIGLPFSDPVADGSVIQRAHQRALYHNITPDEILEIGSRIRRYSAAPMVLFSYFNPLLRKGNHFLKSIKEAGYDGVLVVDQTFEGSEQTEDPYLTGVKKAGLNPILLATPSTEDGRLNAIGKNGLGFVYYVSQKGTTGVRESMATNYRHEMERMRKHINIPIAAGFGIGNKTTAKAAVEYADGFIVGSALVKLIEEGASPEQLKAFARKIDPRIED